VIKFLLLIAVVFVVLSLMRGSRELRRPRDGSQGGRAAAPPPVQQDMVECPVCHVHLPRTDALAGSDGLLYCSPEHRRLSNRA
jgi:uncharacterized protein